MTSPPFRVETVPVRRSGRGPIIVGALAVTLVAISIVKPWAGPAPPAEAAFALQSPGTVAISAADSSADSSPHQGSAVPGVVPDTPGAPDGPAVAPAPLAAGQVECGSADWRIVTLGDFGRWTVRSWIAVTPVEAAGPDDPAIPGLWLGESDVAGMGACAPSVSPTAPGRASRIVEAWWRPLDGATATATGAATTGAATTGAPTTGATTATGAAATATRASFERVTLAQLDPLPSGGPVAVRRLTPTSVTELYRPVPASAGGRWPAGRYVLLLASPDRGPDRWIGIEIGAAGT